MIDVSISMHTQQNDSLGNKDFIKVEAKGNMYEKNNDIYIIYKEEIEKGLEYVTTTIKIAENEVLIKRFGSVKSDMKFIKGVETINKYRTPQGLFNIKINTKKLEVSKVDKQVHLNIEYNMFIEGLFEGTNKVNIDIKDI